MLSLPPRITASTGFDVFCHALEAYTSRMSTPISDLYAERAISIVGRYLREAVIQGGSLEARSQMALADTLAGIAISMGGVTNCHAVAHAAGGIDNVVHGEFLGGARAGRLRVRHALQSGQIQGGREAAEPRG